MGGGHTSPFPSPHVALGTSLPSLSLYRSEVEQVKDTRRGWHVTRLVECLSNVHEDLDLIPRLTSLGVGQCNTQEVRQEDQKLKVVLSYVMSLKLALAT